MGNQNSSNISVNKKLSASDLEELSHPFKDGKKISRLPDSWNILDQGVRNNLEKKLAGSDGTISFEKYQNLAGDAVKGNIEDKTRFLFVLMGDQCRQTKHLKLALSSIFKGLSEIYENMAQTSEPDKLAESMLHDILHKGEKRKTTFGKLGDEDQYELEIDEGDVENILVSHPLVEHIMGQVLSKCFQMKSAFQKSSLPYKDSFCSIFCLLFLNFNFPHKLRDNWRPVFSTKNDGESFSKFAGSILHRGPTVIIIKDNENNVFGGFCSDSWKLGPNFIGSEECFLFHLHPAFNIYDTTPFNKNFQYFNMKQKTMPNGLGQGGQLDYFGYWIDSEFGLVKTSPSCSTFHSPQLGAQEGRIVELEVWGVGPEPDKEDLAGSVLNMDPELQAVMEMMGKTFHSKAIREVDAKEEDEEKQQLEFRNETKEKEETK